MKRRSNLRWAKGSAIAPNMCSPMSHKAPHCMYRIGSSQDILVGESLDYRGKTWAVLLYAIAPGATLRESAEQ